MLIVGAGSSRLAEELCKAEYKSVSNLDYSPVVIAQLNERHKGTLAAEVKNVLADATAMSEIQDATYDAVLDKATFDSVVCGEGGSERAVRMLSEVARVLKPGGRFLLLSNAPPEERLAPHLEKPAYGWTCSNPQEIPKPLSAIGGGSAHFHLYAMAKE